MASLEGQRVLVVGLGLSGVAACELLRSRGARVLAVDNADAPAVRREAAALEAKGIPTRLGVADAPEGAFDLVVTSPGVPPANPLLRAMAARGVRVIGELELGFQQARCLNIAIAGTNGKSTTAGLLAEVLRHNHVRSLVAGNNGVPVCSVVERTRELDFLALEVSAFQLETTEFFRPAIAVLLNLAPDHLDRYPTLADAVRVAARLFANQQAFDWAIVQSEALAGLRSAGVAIPSKVITFSASSRRADLTLDRGLLVSHLEGWSGPLFDMDQGPWRGPHHAENLLAALGVGRVLRIPLDGMVEALKRCTPAAHRCELVAEMNGVRFVNDSKATNLDALHKALLAVPAVAGGAPNVWLIAGGEDKGFDYHDLGPLLSQRVKGALLLGAARERMRAAWSLFTPCTVVDSLVEAVSEAARQAVAGDVVLLSPACSGVDQFQGYQHRGEAFRQAVQALTLSRGPVPIVDRPAGESTGKGRGLALVF
jgi:UDP-N-acetylmuramoylalanine--D-glutamate ligase